VFDGMIDSINPRKEKENQSSDINCIGTFGIANDSYLEHQVKELTDVEVLFNTLLQVAGLQDGPSVPEGTVSRDIFPAGNPPTGKIRTFLQLPQYNVRVKGGTSLAEQIKDINKNYSLNIYQSGDGIINIVTPSQLLQQPEGLSFYSWIFRIGGDDQDNNVFAIDYGDTTNSINTVVCLGAYSNVGYAYDPGAVQLNAGDRTVGPQDYVTEVIERRDVISDEQCEEVAKDYLLKVARNYTIQITTEFNPQYMIGQPFKLYDNDKYPNGQIFFIKRYEVSISKDNVSCVITGYANSITVLPENLVLSKTGITDVDYLDTEYEVEQAVKYSIGGFD